MSALPPTPRLELAWRPRLLELADEVRAAARSALLEALAAGAERELARPLSQGAGDVTFGLDVAAERAVDRWLAAAARTGPLSLLTEDAGWRHLGPGPAGEPLALESFDHGGPRIVIDPVDGTRNLMADLRSAWTVIGLAPPGAGQPRYRDLTLGVVSELPDSRAARLRRIAAIRGAGATLALAPLAPLDGKASSERALRVDADDRADHGYFPFFAYHPAMRPESARLAARFFERLEREERAELAHCYDDQLISSGGQLALLALGTYRMVVDARALLAARAGRPTQVSKPYDLAGAALCASEAGCVLLHPEGGELDFPIDAHTPVDFAGFANAASARRLAPHLAAALAEDAAERARAGPGARP